ncbi:ATP-dependent DNA ligase [Ilumatobacter sp.]|uniref:ATP-dependent DNA ligase n=1 Tax=Ilumatobacter sp. TaxID=1967498 RepID=UPI003B51C4DF
MDDDAERPWNLPIQPPIEPMLAKLARTIPTAGDGDWIFEPKWDGFRCVVFRDGYRLELFSRKLKPLARYFPELDEPLRRALPERCVVDGEIVVPDRGDRGLDFDALLQRIHPARSRIERLAAQTPSELVAFDVLALGDESLLDTAMRARRERLVEAVTENERVRITPASSDRGRAEEWFSTFEGAGLDGIVAKPAAGPYAPGKRALVKVKHSRTADCAVPGYRVHKDGEGVGSLLLGLYADDGDLRSVGVAAAFSRARRSELLDELAPRTGPEALDGHPWVEWARHQEERAAAEASGAPTPPSAGSRWSVGKDLSFVPIRMGLVAEVSFGQLEGGRFRHGVSFVRWRPDRSPESCRFDQLEVAEPVRFADLF